MKSLSFDGLFKMLEIMNYVQISSRFSENPPASTQSNHLTEKNLKPKKMIANAYELIVKSDYLLEEFTKNFNWNFVWYLYLQFEYEEGCREKIDMVIILMQKGYR